MLTLSACNDDELNLDMPDQAYVPDTTYKVIWNGDEWLERFKLNVSAQTYCANIIKDNYEQYFKECAATRDELSELMINNNNELLSIAVGYQNANQPDAMVFLNHFENPNEAAGQVNRGLDTMLEDQKYILTRLKAYGILQTLGGRKPKE